MKLLMQSDDYGITRAAACGILYGIHEGVIRNTGLFANMPWAAECVEMIRPDLDRIGFGIDLNASTGPSLLGYDKVPGLCHKDGSFYTSRENRALDEKTPDHDHVVYDQIYAEFEAQILKYQELVGRLPDYFHGHAYGTKTTYQASIDLAKKYHRPYTLEISKHEGMKQAGLGWYAYGGSLDDQLKEDPISYITSDPQGLLQSEYGYIITHCGYVDAELFKLSSFNVCRAKDLEAVTSDAVKQWIKDNKIELITFRDIPETWY
jgi:predicted glycoside hydrolase/deacetylase ChbG (UPF0249 family)